MMPAPVAVALVLAALAAVMAGAPRAGRRLGGSAETQRKAVHIAMGCVCASFPWVFASPGPVWVLAGLAVAALAAVRIVPALRARLGASLHDVGRDSWGDLLFPVSVAVLFALRDGELAPYLVPLLVLTLADAAGALAGSLFGRRVYDAVGGRKSLEGSLVFLVIAFFAALVVLRGTTDLGAPEAAIVALLVAVLSAAVEGLFGRGWDNLWLPLGAWYFTRYTAPLALPELLAHLAAVLVWGGFAWWARNRGRFTGGGVLTTFLPAYACFTWGGPLWFAAAAIVMAHHLVQVRRLRGERVEMFAFHAVASVAFGLVAWPVAHRFLDVDGARAFPAFLAAASTHAVLFMNHGPAVTGPRHRPSVAGVALVWLTLPAPLAVLGGAAPAAWILGLPLLHGAAAAVDVAWFRRRGAGPLEWYKRTLIALAISGAVWSLPP